MKNIICIYVFMRINLIGVCIQGEDNILKHNYN